MAKAAIAFVAVGNELHLTYRPRDDTSWVRDRLKRGEDLVLKGTFHVCRDDLVDASFLDTDAGGEAIVETDSAWEPDGDLAFVVAKAQGEYFLFNPRNLPVGVPVLIGREAQPSWKWFSAEKRTSILAVVAELRPSRIAIGGPDDDAIPVAVFENLVSQFPTNYELKRYVLARVASVVRQYTDASVDAESMLSKLVSKRVRNEPTSVLDEFREVEQLKYQCLRDRLALMLASENAYAERTWQTEILGIVRLLNPKYIAAFTSVSIKDSETATRRELDFLLVDASGHVDVIEIKKPFGKAVMSETVYRDNHIPLRELCGSIMQIEKYIYHLNRWGRAGEQTLTRRFADKLPTGFAIRITNPCGIVIMGRDMDLSQKQRHDFEIFRRQNKNIVDVMTYDDLLRRLDVVLEQLRTSRRAVL